MHFSYDITANLKYSKMVIFFNFGHSIFTESILCIFSSKQPFLAFSTDALSNGPDPA